MRKGYTRITSLLKDQNSGKLGKSGCEQEGRLRLDFQHGGLREPLLTLAGRGNISSDESFKFLFEVIRAAAAIFCKGRDDYPGFEHQFQDRAIGRCAAAARERDTASAGGGRGTIGGSFDRPGLAALRAITTNPDHGRRLQ